MLVHFALFGACFVSMFGGLDDVVCIFKLLKLLMIYEPYVCVKALSINYIVSNKCFSVSFLENPQETSFVL